MPLALY